MIRREEHPCYLVHCDTCAEALGTDEFAYAHFESESAAREGAADYDWRIDDSGKAECSSCFDERKLAGADAS